MTPDAPSEVAIRSVHAMSDGDLTTFSRLVHPDATNRESVAEPPDCRGSGPAAFLASARWLRQAWDELRFTVDTHVAEGDLVVTHGTMAGRHTGDFVVHDERGRVAQVFPPTGRSFEVRQAHFFRMKDGLVVEHWAVRDDRALGEQLGWAPPSPAYVVRMMLATRRARRRDSR